jgi:hypothetical protein
VTKDWQSSDFLVGDDVNSELAVQALQNNCLLFSTNFLVQCIAQERLVNAGPFILHQTVQRDDAPREDRVGLAKFESDSEMGDLIAELELLNSPEMSVSVEPVAKKASPARKKNKKKQLVSAEMSEPASSKKSKKAKKAVLQETPEEGTKTKRARSVSKRGPDRRLGVDTVNEDQLQIILEDFEDFTPNVNGALVATVQYRGK